MAREREGNGKGDSSRLICHLRLRWIARDLPIVMATQKYSSLTVQIWARWRKNAIRQFHQISRMRNWSKCWFPRLDCTKHESKQKQFTNLSGENLILCSTFYKAIVCILWQKWGLSCSSILAGFRACTGIERNMDFRTLTPSLKPSLVKSPIPQQDTVSFDKKTKGFRLHGLIYVLLMEKVLQFLICVMLILIPPLTPNRCDRLSQGSKEIVWCQIL